MNFYAVVALLRRTGIEADSAHADRDSAVQRAQEFADELTRETAKSFGSCAPVERYHDTWTVDGGETGTVYVLCMRG